MKFNTCGHSDLPHKSLGFLKTKNIIIIKVNVQNAIMSIVKHLPNKIKILMYDYLEFNYFDRILIKDNNTVISANVMNYFMMLLDYLKVIIN